MQFVVKRVIDMKKFLSRKQFSGPTFNNWMKFLIIGLVLSVLTTVVLQFAMYFQIWGRFDQTLNLGQAVLTSIKFLTRAQALFTIVTCLILFIFIVVLVNR